MKGLFILALAGLGFAKKECLDCLTKADVSELSAAYTRLIGYFDEADLKYLTEDWEDYSQSINSFIKPDAQVYSDPTTLTFDKTAFAAAQENLPEGATPIEIVGEPLVDCNRFAVIWTALFGYPEKKPVRGITIIEAKHVKGGHPVMTKWDVEFNSHTWNLNMGGSYCLPIPDADDYTIPFRFEGNPSCGAASVEVTKKRAIF